MGYFGEGNINDPEIEEIARQRLIHFFSYTKEGLDSSGCELAITELATWRAMETGGDVAVMRNTIAKSCWDLLLIGMGKSRVAPVMIVDEGDGCPICQEDFPSGTEVGCMDCEHLFHYHCIYQWFQTKLNCPLCRFECQSL